MEVLSRSSPLAASYGYPFTKDLKESLNAADKSSDNRQSANVSSPATMNCFQLSGSALHSSMCNKSGSVDSSQPLVTSSGYELPFCMDDDERSVPPEAALTFHLPDGGTQQVVVEENLRCIDLCHLLTLKLNVARSPTWTIIERIPDLNIERSLEDHEEVLQVYASWGKSKEDSQFIFRQDFRKYEFFHSPLQFFSLDMVDFGSQLDCLAESTDLAKLVTLQNLLNQGEKCPVICSQLWCQESGKEAWKRSYFHVENSDISISTSSSKDVWQLKHFADLSQWNIYTALSKNPSGPTKYQFCLKAASGNLMWFCSDSEQQRQCWIIALRLAKFGKKLRENYKESKSRCMEHAWSEKSSSPWVAMDFTGTKGRVINNPQEAEAIATAEAHTWKRKLGCCRHTSLSPSTPQSRPLVGQELGIEHTQPWFYSGMSRDEATHLLLRHGTVDGVFLVRHSLSKPGNYVLCYAYKGKVHHVQVIVMEEKEQPCYSLDGGRTKFYDLLQLVEFYQLNLSYLPTKLTHFLVHHPKRKDSTGSSA